MKYRYKKYYNIRYKTEILHEKLTIEECLEKLQDYADQFYAQKEISFDPQYLKMEENT